MKQEPDPAQVLYDEIQEIRGALDSLCGRLAQLAAAMAPALPAEGDDE
jgi:hypothetical protein